MKNFIICLMVSLRNIIFGGFNPFTDGANLAVTVCVKDDTGCTVSNANVSVLFYVAPQKADIIKGITDDNGEYKAENRCTEELKVVVRKNGYYETFENVKYYRKLALPDVKKKKRWSDTPVQINLTLKKIHNPIKLKAKEIYFKMFPVTNTVVKLDLEMLDWCPPYGKGKHDDMHMIFDDWQNPNEVFDFHQHLKFSMPNKADGFYRIKTDSFSDFKYAYTADTNTVYQKELEFRHVCTREKIVESVKLDKDEYLIYRIRTETNELGRVTSARYGRIGEGFSQLIGLSMKSWINPTANDTNLEDTSRP